MNNFLTIGQIRSFDYMFFLINYLIRGILYVYFFLLIITIFISYIRMKRNFNHLNEEKYLILITKNLQ